MKAASQLSVAGEFDGARLGDVRREDRLKALALALAADPSKSFPTAVKTHAALEGAYRFLRNEAVSMDGILSGHYEQTAERAAAEKVVLALHDTSVFKFEGQREGLGPAHGGQGFYGHFTLLVTPGETRKPLGIIALQKWMRVEGGQKKKEKKSGQSMEAARWKKGAALAEERVAGRCSLIHVMDREGDSYDLWAALIASGSRFVIRNSRNRVLEDGSLLIDEVARAKTVVKREVKLSRRTKSFPDKRKQAQSRDGRIARLALSARTVTISRPIQCSKELPPSLMINFVHVKEIGAEHGQEPVEWMLATTERIETAEDIERIVDIYRVRWVIEEYFKALKTGCDYENRQLESDQTLTNALAIFVPIAWQLLLLRSLARRTGQASAEEALTRAQIDVLVATSKGELPKNPTLQQALLAVAALGGHIKNNGQPGWLVLGRGFQFLLILEKGWKAAKRSDQ